MTLAKDLGIEVREIAIPREMLYLADELFFTGTATEVAPIRSVDAIQIGNGKRGPDHAQAAGGLLRPRAGQDAGHARLARLRRHECAESRSSRLVSQGTGSVFGFRKRCLTPFFTKTTP